jgi:tRNA-specific 2-thiouridylase
MVTAVAMSGGVDSSTAAALLAENKPAEDRVIGLTMQLWNQRRLPALLGFEGAPATGGQASGRCCSLDDVYDARRVADFLGIPYYVVNYQAQFEETVVRPFVAQYLAGETPVPCAHCNTEVKFEQFVKTALEIGAERIATGHYARVQRDESTGRYRLLRAVDATKDQTYFLFGLTQEQLARSIFPLGELTKEQVREIARARKLPVAEKAESQEICFVPTGSYRDFIEAYLAEQGRASADRPGEIVSTDGRVLAEHAGVHHFTVGQRKGLGFHTGEPLYVIAIDPAQNRVVVGKNEELFRTCCEVRDVNWIRPAAHGETFEAQVKIRNKHAAARALIRVVAATSRSPLAENGGLKAAATVEFVEPQRAITPGQAAVFYDGEEVLGGGWISKVC